MAFRLMQFDQNGNFVYIPFSNLSAMTECLRRRVIKLFIEKKLINQHVADNLLRLSHSGFSIDSSIRLFDGSQKDRENLAQYIAPTSKGIYNNISDAHAS